MSLWIPNSSHSSFTGTNSMVSFEKKDTTTTTKTKREEQSEEEEDQSEEIRALGKKRRLSVRQVEFLEKSFDLENKLEPERKLELATELGLQPRQVAIWFQNRRARFKTKQLEKDFDSLSASYQALKSDYDSLLSQNNALKLQVNSIKERLGIKEELGKKDCSESETQIAKTASADVSNAQNSGCKNEDASSAKSDVVDSSGDSPNNYAEPEISDFSQDYDGGDDFATKKIGTFLAPPLLYLPKLESCYYDEPPPGPVSSCHFGFAAEDQPFNFWPY